ncbi:MAG TPA: family 43 glycosylhydrolase [Jatrophihabitans sp.]
MQLPVRPVIAGFHPDPSLCRVGEDYYLVCSSFEYAPGVPLYHSTDLRSWQQLGHVLDRPSQLSVVGAASSGGVYAPTLRYHDGRCYLITTNTSDRSGQFLVTAENPAGPWSDPVWVPNALGIDPDLAWDDDGTCYLTWSALSTAGHDGIVQAVLDPVTGALLSECHPLWRGTGGKFPEAPHLYHIGKYWYLMIAEGGTERGHAVTIARGPSPAGPFEPSPRNPLVTARGTDSPVQNTGHADLVERPDGRWAMVYLGIRPRGYTPQWHVLGRETFASEMAWSDDGWPALAEPIEPAASDTFFEQLAGPGLPPSWVAPGGFPEDVLQPLDGGGWRLSAGSGAPTFAGRRQEHLAIRAQASIAAGHGAGGLELRIDPRHAVSLEVADGRVRAVAGSVRCAPRSASSLPVRTSSWSCGPSLASSSRSPASRWGRTNSSRASCGPTASRRSGASTGATSRPRSPAASPAAWSGCTAPAGTSTSGRSATPAPTTSTLTDYSAAVN